MEKVLCRTLSPIHIFYNHGPVQAQLCTQCVWAHLIIT